MQLFLFTICFLPIYSHNKNLGKKLFFLTMIAMEVYGILIGIDYDYRIPINFSTKTDNR